MTLMAPRDEAMLVHMLHTALHVDGPAAVRYPRGAGVGVELPAAPELLRVGTGEILREGERVALIGYGTGVGKALGAADLLAERGLDVTVADARFAKPLDALLLASLAADHDLLVTVEEGVLAGGFGSAVWESPVRGGLAGPADPARRPARPLRHPRRSGAAARRSRVHARAHRRARRGRRARPAPHRVGISTARRGNAARCRSPAPNAESQAYVDPSGTPLPGGGRVGLRKRYLPWLACAAVAAVGVPAFASGEPSPSGTPARAGDHAVERLPVREPGDDDEHGHDLRRRDRHVQLPGRRQLHNVAFGRQAHRPARSRPRARRPPGDNIGAVPPLPPFPTPSDWAGSCRFNTPGTYAFFCRAHAFMTGRSPCMPGGSPTPTPESVASPSPSPSPVPSAEPVAVSRADAGHDDHQRPVGADAT